MDIILQHFYGQGVVPAVQPKESYERAILELSAKLNVWPGSFKRNELFHIYKGQCESTKDDVDFYLLAQSISDFARSLQASPQNIESAYRRFLKGGEKCPEFSPIKLRPEVQNRYAALADRLERESASRRHAVKADMGRLAQHARKLADHAGAFDYVTLTSLREIALMMRSAEYKGIAAKLLNLITWKADGKPVFPNGFGQLFAHIMNRPFVNGHTFDLKTILSELHSFLNLSDGIKKFLRNIVGARENIPTFDHEIKNPLYLYSRMGDRTYGYISDDQLEPSVFKAGVDALDNARMNSLLVILSHDDAVLTRRILDVQSKFHAEPFEPAYVDVFIHVTAALISTNQFKGMRQSLINAALFDLEKSARIKSSGEKFGDLDKRYVEALLSRDETLYQTRATDLDAYMNGYDRRIAKKRKKAGRGGPSGTSSSTPPRSTPPTRSSPPRGAMSQSSKIEVIDFEEIDDMTTAGSDVYTSSSGLHAGQRSMMNKLNNTVGGAYRASYQYSAAQNAMNSAMRFGGTNMLFRPAAPQF